MATENVTLIDTTERAAAVQKLGIDLDGYRQAIKDGEGCIDAVKLLTDKLQGSGFVVEVLLGAILSYMETSIDTFIETGHALGIKPYLDKVIKDTQAANSEESIAGDLTRPSGQAVTLSDIDMAMLRNLHTLPIQKQLALVSLMAAFGTKSETV